MTGIALALTLQSVLAVSAPGQTYAQAAKAAEKSGKPLLVLVGADWCRYCKIVERDVLPVLKKNGLLDKVEFVYLDYDRDRRQVMQLLQGEIIPEMVMFTKTAKGWNKRHLSGGYKLEEISEFIKAGLPTPTRTAATAP